MADVVKSLEDVKVGDLFLIRNKSFNQRLFPGSVYAIVNCEKVTAKQCTINGNIYRKSDARCMGDRSYYETLIPYCEEGRIAIIRQEHIAYLQHSVTEKALISMSNADLEKTYNFFKQLEIQDR